MIAIDQLHQINGLLKVWRKLEERPGRLSFSCDFPLTKVAATIFCFPRVIAFSRVYKYRFSVTREGTTKVRLGET